MTHTSQETRGATGARRDSRERVAGAAPQARAATKLLQAPGSSAPVEGDIEVLVVVLPPRALLEARLRDGRRSRLVAEPQRLGQLSLEGAQGRAHRLDLDLRAGARARAKVRVEGGG